MRCNGLSYCSTGHFGTSQKSGFFWFTNCIAISNDNRGEWSPIRSVLIRVINKTGRPRSSSLICESLVWLQTELNETKSCYQLIIAVIISEKTNIFRANISGGDNVWRVKYRYFGNSPVFFQNKWLLLWLLWSILWLMDLEWSELSMIGCLNCPITGVRLQPTV